MALLFIDFPWRKDAAGYRLVDAEPPKPERTAVDPSSGRRRHLTILERDPGKPLRIVPKGGKREQYQPLIRFPELYKAFASLREPNDVLRFVQNYGPLTHDGLEPSRGEDVELVLGLAGKFRVWLDRGRGGRKQVANWIGTQELTFANLQASLVAGPSGELRLRVAPRNLLGGLWLQLAQALAGGARIRECQHCGCWFETGPGTGRRLDAMYCSTQHQIDYNSLNRRGRRKHA
jgi:hypothetical protein